MPDPAPFPCTPFHALGDRVWSADPSAPGLQVADVDPDGNIDREERARLAKLFAASPDLYAAGEGLVALLSGPASALDDPAGERAPLAELDGTGALVRISSSPQVAALRAAVARARGGG